MPEFLASKIYQQAAHELYQAPPLQMEELFNNGVVRYRVGKIISEAARKPEYGMEEFDRDSHDADKRALALAEKRFELKSFVRLLRIVGEG
jgi:hypothetical protein